MTYRDAVEDYIQARSSVAAPNTIRNHRRNADNLQAYCGGRDPLLVEVADDLFLGRYADARAKHRLRNGNQISQNTVKSELGSILAVCRRACRKGQCDHVDYEPPGRIERAPRALSLKEVEKLLVTTAKMTGTYMGVPACVRYAAFINLSLCTAERKDAIRQVNWSDIQGDYIYFRANTRKGGKRETCRGMSDAVIESLAILAQWDEPQPFAWVADRSFYSIWDSIKFAGELPEWLTPHKLRATAATHCATIGEAQQLLDHSSARITLRYYWCPEARKDRGVPATLAEALAKAAPKKTLFSAVKRRLGWAG